MFQKHLVKVLQMIHYPSNSLLYYFLFFFVLFIDHCHVISIEVNQKDFVEEKKKEYKNPNVSISVV